MEMIRRKIKLFFVSYGKLISFIIGAIFVAVTAIQTLNSLVKENNDYKYSSEEYQNKIKNQEEQTEDILYILDFIKYCNEKNINEAYKMLSDKCKNEKYRTKEEFEKNYINQVFSISITKQDVNKLDNIYKVTLTQNPMETGKKDSKIETQYKVENLLERKIYIIR